MVAQRYVKNHTDELALEDSKLSSGDRIVRFKAKTQVAQSASLSLLKMSNDRPSVIMKLVS